MPLFWGRGWINNKGTHANNFEAGQDLLQYTLVVETVVGSNIVIEAPNQNDAIGFVISPKGAVLGSRVDVLLFEEFHLDEAGSGSGELITDFVFDSLTNLLTLTGSTTGDWIVDLSSIIAGQLIGETSGNITNPAPIGANHETYLGENAGNGITALNATCIGYNAGSGSTAVVTNLIAIGNGAGSLVTAAGQSNGLIAIGSQAGNGASNPYRSQFFGPAAGSLSTGCNDSVFNLNGAGEQASGANDSWLTGYNAGRLSQGLSNTFVWGFHSCENDIVVVPDWNIILGPQTHTGGFVRSVLLGGSILGNVTNTRDDQFMLADSIINVRWGGIEYVFPPAQGGAATVLTNDGAGNLSWGAGGGGGGTPGGVNTNVQYNDNGAFGGDNNFTWDKNNLQFFVGDLLSAKFGTYLAVNDAAQQVTAYAGVFDGAGSPGPYPQFLALDGSNNTAAIGGVDAGAGNNATIIGIDGINLRVSFNSSQGGFFGNTTQLYLDGNFFATQDIATSRLFIGTNAPSSGSGNADLIVGIGSAMNLTNGGNCIVVGHGSGTSLTSDSATLIFGNQSGTALTGASGNLIFGNSSAQVLTGTGNVFIGNICNAGTIGVVNHCIAIGTNTTNNTDNQLVIGGNKSAGNHVTDGYFGSGVFDSTPHVSFTLHATGGQDVITPTPNVVGAMLIMAAGKSSGNAVPASFKIQTSTAGSSGTTLQTLADRVIVDGSTGGTRVLFDHGTADTIWGRDSANGGLVAITLGTNLSLAGSTLNATGGAGGVSIGDAVGGSTDKSVLFIDGIDLAEDNANFNYDKTTKILLIDTVHVSSSLILDGTLIDGTAVAGTSGQVLSSTGTEVLWIDFPASFITSITDTSTIDLKVTGTDLTADVINSSITYAKIQDVTDQKILGRSSGSAGPIQEITIGTGLDLTTGILTSTITQYTNELAQDAIGAMIDSSLVYVDATPLLTRAALTGDITASQGSNATTLATVNSNIGTFGSATQVGVFTVNAKGLITAASNTSIQIAESQVTNLTTDLAAKLTTTLTSGNIFVGSVGNVATSVTMGGDATIIASGALTIANNAVSDAKLRQSAGLSVIGRASNTTGNVADITAASDFQVLRRSGTSIGFGAIDLSQSAAVTGLLAGTNGGTGVNNSTRTITIGGNFATSGAFATTLTVTATTNVTLPTTGTLATLAGTETFTNKRVTRRLVTTNAPGATPTTNTDSVDIREFTGLATAITSMTTNLSGTPVNGDLVEFIFLDDGTARAITWGSSFSNGGLVNLPTTTVISVVLRVLVQYQTIASLNKWVCIAVA